MDEESAYKRFVLGVAQAAAEAHKEGGFIGIGGKRISDEERVALDEIEAMLDENVAVARAPELEPPTSPFEWSALPVSYRAWSGKVLPRRPARAPPAGPVPARSRSARRAARAPGPT